MSTCIVSELYFGIRLKSGKSYFSFTVPKDPERVKLWTTAVRHTDNSIKSGSAVCEKHFRKSDILWKRELPGFDGQVLGRSHFKVPRLNKGCVPSQFPWTKCTESEQLENLLEKIHRLDAKSRSAQPSGVAKITAS